MEQGTFVGSGTWKVDWSARKRKLKENRMKILRHRAGVVLNHVVKPIATGPAALVVGFLVLVFFSILICGYIAFKVFGPDWIELGMAFGVGSAIFFPLTLMHLDSEGHIRAIKEKWNP